MVEKKPINVEAQRISRMLDEYVNKLHVLSLLSAELFIEVRKKSEEELTTSWGKDIGTLLFDQAYREDSFATVNIKTTQKMEPLDSEEMDARERYEARTNAHAIRKNSLKLSRMFQKK